MSESPVLGLREALVAVVVELRSVTTHEDGWCTVCGEGEESDGPRHAEKCHVGILLAQSETALAAHDRIAARTADFEPPTADTITVGDLAGLRRTT